MALEDKTPEELIKLIQTSHNLRKRADRKAAAANKRNLELEEQLRKARFENRVLKVEIAADSDVLRERLRIAEERLSLISELAERKSDTTRTYFTWAGSGNTEALY